MSKRERKGESMQEQLPVEDGTAHVKEALWAIHVEGPDDVVAMPDEATARRHAKAINELYERFARRPDASPVDGRWDASVIEWPFHAHEHAGELARLKQEGGYQP